VNSVHSLEDDMGRYGEMLVLIRAVEDGGFSIAGQNLSLTPSSVSTAIAAGNDGWRAMTAST
jgi:hypothetical protein